MTRVAAENNRSAMGSIFGPAATAGWFLCAFLALTDQWLLAPALFLLLVGWRILTRDEMIPVAAAAFTFQWLQITIALFYFALTGNKIVEMSTSNYQPMVLIALASIASLFAGYYLAKRHRPVRSSAIAQGVEPHARLTMIATAYVIALVVSLTIQRVAWSFAALTQILFMLGFARYAVLYVLIARLMKPSPRWLMIAVVLFAELAIGFGGYFASFRESLVIIALAIIANSSERRATTWFAASGIAALTVYAAMTWTAIKPIIREEYSAASSTADRLRNVARAMQPAIESSAKPVKVLDNLVSRMWQIYYPSLALARVPASVPFENGAILQGALSNTFMPRMFFPDKGILPSESEKVRKYAGVWVAGRETNTSFAFGYVAESYVDFGWPLMLLPILFFGCLLGLADRVIQKVIRNGEFLQGIRVVFLWSSMYMFEVSWVIVLGTALSLFAVLLVGGVLIDRAFGNPRKSLPASVYRSRAGAFDAGGSRRAQGSSRIQPG